MEATGHNPRVDRRSYSPSTFVVPVIGSFFSLIMLSDTFSLVLKNKGLSYSKYIDEIIFCIFIACVFLMVSIWRQQMAIHRTLPLILLFCALGAFSTIVGRVPVDIAVLGFILCIKPLVIFFGCNLIPFSKQAGARLLKCLPHLFACFILSAFAYELLIRTIIGWNLVPGFDLPQRMGITPARSFFTHPGPFSSMMVVFATFYWSSYLVKRSNISFVLFVVSIMCLAMSVRIKALIVMPLVLLVVYCLVSGFHRINYSRILIGLVLTITILCFLCLVIWSFQSDLKFYFNDNNEAVRTLLFTNAIEINKDTLGVGAGYGMYGSSVSVSKHYSNLYYDYGISDLYGASPDNPSFITDQWWAWYLGEVGLIGFSLFIIILVKIIVGLIKIGQFWKGKEPALSVLAYSSVGVLCYGILSGFADGNLTTPPTGYFIMSLAGLAYAINRAFAR